MPYFGNYKAILSIYLLIKANRKYSLILIPESYFPLITFHSIYLA